MGSAWRRVRAERLTATAPACANAESDSANCGSCGHACAADQTCVAANCVATCGAPFVACDGSCADTAKDSMNCAGCGNQSGPNQTCVASQRIASCGTLTPCRGNCVDTANDSQNCGRCGNPCDVGQAFVGGAGRCVDTTSDADDCGGCGVACSSTQVCKASAGVSPTGVGPHGGSVALLKFGMTGDPRPPSCEDTADYPTAVIDRIVDQISARGPQFVLDLGDLPHAGLQHSLPTATAQMNLYLQAPPGLAAPSS